MGNIAILSAGRRVDLVRAFQHELNQDFPSAKVITTDLAPDLSSACQIADRFFQSPKVVDANYIDFLFDLCCRREIKLVIPTIDTELLKLSESAARFQAAGIHVVISDEKLVKFCRDKRLSGELFRSIGIEYPKEYSRDNLFFPCFAKPYDGSCSANTFRLLQKTDLTESIYSNDKLIYFEYIDEAYEEFTIDAYYDRLGELKCLVPRQRIEVRGGEISKGITRKGFVYDFCLECLKKIHGARGCLTVQVFANKKTHRILGIEINPRFGGGFPLTYRAGGNYPRWLIEEYLLDQPTPFFDNWKANLLMLRYDSAVFIEHEN